MARNATITISVNSPKARMLENYPSAGPNPNITGMKNMYWGKDAYCIKCGSYVYNVPKEVYNQF